jgi:hypothetical protein
MTARYAVFTGVEEGKARVEAGQTLVLAYAATVDKGTLTIKVQTAGQETIWETTLSEDTDEQQIELAPVAGNCTILVIGDESGGSFALSWTVQ